PTFTQQSLLCRYVSAWRVMRKARMQQQRHHYPSLNTALESSGAAARPSWQPAWRVGLEVNGRSGIIARHPGTRAAGAPIFGAAGGRVWAATYSSPFAARDGGKARRSRTPGIPAG